MAHEAGPRGFSKCQAELNAGDGLDQRLVDVLDGLDEMRLANDYVDIFSRPDNFNCLDFHRLALSRRTSVDDMKAGKAREDTLSLARCRPSDQGNPRKNCRPIST